MLNNMLAPQFHLYVLLSGIALVTLALLRGFALWVQVGKEKEHAHDHDHEHVHDHGHEHHDHDEHFHEHGAACTHDHAHDHGHDHEHHVGHAHAHHHHHDHDAADHDHGWAPWRYVVLLVPVILFLLGLPSKGPQAGQTKPIFTQETAKEAARDA